MRMSDPARSHDRHCRVVDATRTASVRAMANEHLRALGRSRLVRFRIRIAAELRRLLGIPNSYQIIVNAALGYSECAAVVPLRKPLDSTCVIRSNESQASDSEGIRCDRHK